MRVTVTNLETFRLFRVEDWMDFDHLMASITGNEAWDPVTSMIGDAFHDALRRLGVGEHDRLQSGRWRFNLKKIEGELALYPLRELRVNKKYDVGGEEIEVRGRVDGADGVAVEDHKLKFGVFDAERYTDSDQWKFYLDMMGGDIFRYNVFEGPDSDSAAMRDVRAAWNLCPCPVLPPSCRCPMGAPCDCPVTCTACTKPTAMHDYIEIEIRAFHSLTLYRYPELNQHVIDRLREYAAFAEQHLTEAAILAWQRRMDAGHAHIDPGK